MRANLTDEQRAWWQRLRELEELEKECKGNLQFAVRKLAIEILRAQSNEKAIVTQGETKEQVWRAFPNAQAKKDFLANHSNNGVWGEDAILFPLLQALGYTVFINLVGTGLPAYLPLSPSETGLSVTINNFGARQYGKEVAEIGVGAHFELAGKASSYDGNCMYAAVAQAVERDREKVVANANTANVENAANAADPDSESVSDIELPQENQKAVASEVATAVEKFKARDQEDDARFEVAKKDLEQCSVETLIALYQYALKKLVGQDTYLKNRPAVSAREHGNDFLAQALKGNINKDIKVLIHEELVHALAREIWRNPAARERFEEEKNSLSAKPVGIRK